MLGLILSSGSCEKQLKDDIALSVARTEVDSKAGSHIITVKASGEWYLSLYFADGAEPWAELSETRGEGNSNRVVLKYGENKSYSSRTVMLILTSAFMLTWQVTRIRTVSDSAQFLILLK